MNRPRAIWIGFGLCLAVLLGTTGWMTWTALRLESYQQHIRQAETTEEKLRLSLWRMDSLMAPFIAQEISRPFYSYFALHPMNGKVDLPAKAGAAPAVQAPSPLLTETVTNVLLHFQLAETGPVTSPECPAPALRGKAGMPQIPPERLKLMEKRLLAFQTLMAKNASKETNLANSGLLFLQLPASVDNNNAYTVNDLAQSPKQAAEPDRQMTAQYAMNARELKNRSQQISQALNYNGNNSQVFGNSMSWTESVTPGAMQPMWIDDTLILARRIHANGQDYVQGCWLDWPGLTNTLTDCVRDLWPDAPPRLLPSPTADPRGHNLASLPVRLIPQAVRFERSSGISAVRILLCVAWAGMILATAAVAVLLYGVVGLSERRAMFVSAVTHELRTPLTTFKLYSEMLAAGMVRDEATRGQYLKTLCSEANRLGHLIENVLSYSRLERGSARASIETVSAGDLLNRITPRLEERAAQAGLTLLTDIDAGAGSALLHIDTTGVEQILFNLIDNACKYASAGTAPLLHLQAQQPENGTVAIRVRDHGPGLCADAMKRLFQPFGKSAQRAANGPPGVGLGLALSRRLSRSLGGSLELIQTGPEGTVFELRLPLKN